MILLGILLGIVSITKLCIASESRQVELRKLVSNLPIHADIIDPLTKSIIIADGLIGLICALVLICI